MWSISHLCLLFKIYLLFLLHHQFLPTSFLGHSYHHTNTSHLKKIFLDITLLPSAPSNPTFVPLYGKLLKGAVQWLHPFLHILIPFPLHSGFHPQALPWNCSWLGGWGDRSTGHFPTFRLPDFSAGFAIVHTPAPFLGYVFPSIFQHLFDFLPASLAAASPSPLLPFSFLISNCFYAFFLPCLFLLWGFK